MMPLEFLLFVEPPICLEVTPGAKRAQLQHRFGTFQAPPRPGQVHAIFDQMAASPFKQSPQSLRRNGSPVKLIDGLLLLCHEHLSGSLVKLVEIAQTPSRANGVFHRPPKAFHGVKMVAPVSR